MSDLETFADVLESADWVVIVPDEGIPHIASYVGWDEDADDPCFLVGGDSVDNDIRITADNLPEVAADGGFRVSGCYGAFYPVLKDCVGQVMKLPRREFSVGRDIKLWRDEDNLRVRIESDRIDADCLICQFTHEGLIIDAVTGGVVEGSSGKMYDEVEDSLE